MAFTGTPVVTQISDRQVRITGLSLASAAAGTIGLAGNTGPTPGVSLPASFNPSPYTYGDNHPVTLVDAVECTCESDAVGVATAIPLAVVKSGTTHADFLITITNTHGSLASPAQEIMVKYH